MESMKVVINVSYGSFGLSLEAAEMLEAAGVEPRLVSLGTCSAMWWGKRHDERLIAVVEQLGVEAAASPYAHLEIVDIDGPYRIIEHDGLENIETPATIRWIQPVAGT